MRNYVKHILHETCSTCLYERWHKRLDQSVLTGRLLEIDVPLNGIAAREAFVKVARICMADTVNRIRKHCCLSVLYQTRGKLNRRVLT